MLSGTSLLCGFLLLGFNANYVFTLPTYWGLYWCKCEIKYKVRYKLCKNYIILCNFLKIHPYWL